MKSVRGLVISVFVIGLCGCATLSQSPARVLVSVTPGPRLDCGYSFKWNCILLTVRNNDHVSLWIPVSGSVKRLFVYGSHYEFEEREREGNKSTWEPTAVTLADYYPPNEDAVVRQGEQEKFWIPLPGWDARDRGKVFRIVLYDENRTKYFSIPFDAEGNTHDEK